jgi:hypothetical protein
MKIYRIYNPNRQFKTIAYESSPLFNNIGEKIVWDNSNDLQSFHFLWDDNSIEKSSCDCPFIIGSIPVFSKISFNIISTYIHLTDVQVIPIEVENMPYYILNVIKLMDNILDTRNSKITYFRDGKIMDIENYVFKKVDTLPPFFRLLQLPLFTFITEDVANCIISSNLNFTGITLDECHISERYFFK